jgi:phosphoglucosamine mutase
MAHKYFGTEGIRGHANVAITPELALRVGQAAGLIFRHSDYRNRVLIGKDTRRSGYMIETALIAGFTSVGMDVLLTGPIPTPAVGMLTRSMRADLGVMISASHNPFDDNGIKLFGPDGFKLSDEVEQKIEMLMDSDFTKQLAKSGDLGRAKRIDGVQDRYIEFAKRTLPRNLSLEGLRVIIDCANGAGYRVAPEALRELDAEVIAIGIEPDGVNINRECGLTDPTALRQKVKEMRADVGIALDGDADRLLIVDERGDIVDGDQLLAVIAESWQADGRLAKSGIVASIMSNLRLEHYLGNLGLALVRMPVGCVLEHMRGQRRALGPHHSFRSHDHRRWPISGAAGARRRGKAAAAGIEGLPPVRSAAASAQERAPQGWQAARKRQSPQCYQGRRSPSRRPRPAGRASFGYRTGHPRDG